MPAARRGGKRSNRIRKAGEGKDAAWRSKNIRHAYYQSDKGAAFAALHKGDQAGYKLLWDRAEAAHKDWQRGGRRKTMHNQWF